MLFFFCTLQSAAKLGHRKRRGGYLPFKATAGSAGFSLRGKQLWVPRAEVRLLFHAKVGRFGLETCHPAVEEFAAAEPRYQHLQRRWKRVDKDPGKRPERGAGGRRKLARPTRSSHLLLLFCLWGPRSRGFVSTAFCHAEGLNVRPCVTRFLPRGARVKSLRRDEESRPERGGRPVPPSIPRVLTGNSSGGAQRELCRT